MTEREKSVEVGVILGSKSDLPLVKKAEEIF
ncbi:MAG TPA: hypothetical protein DIC53_03535, partial [Synergistaceae bacterium]|nr:hypothetical protein [Synergistaceae bacterium]